MIRKYSREDILRLAIARELRHKDNFSIQRLRRLVGRLHMHIYRMTEDGDCPEYAIGLVNIALRNYVTEEW
ncbi:MAG: hypothetical protein ACE5FT_05325 [Candidatus Nanoarchaeia archaeon]